MRHAAEIDRPRHVAPGLKHPLLVELAIVRQVDLVALGQHLAAIEQRRSNCGVPLLRLQRHADDDARPAIGGVGGQRLDRLLAGAQEGRLAAPGPPADSRR